MSKIPSAIEVAEHFIKINNAHYVTLYPRVDAFFNKQLALPNVRMEQDRAPIYDCTRDPHSSVLQRLESDFKQLLEEKGFHVERLKIEGQLTGDSIYVTYILSLGDHGPAPSYTET